MLGCGALMLSGRVSRHDRFVQYGGYLHVADEYDDEYQSDSNRMCSAKVICASQSCSCVLVLRILQSLSAACHDYLNFSVCMSRRMPARPCLPATSAAEISVVILRYYRVVLEPQVTQRIYFQCELKTSNLDAPGVCVAGDDGPGII
jgi:hypothetical protein